MKNVELLKQVRDQVFFDPAHHNQNFWARAKADTISTEVVTDKWGNQFQTVGCGTQACQAGWAVQLAGDTLLIESDELYCGDLHLLYCQTPDGAVCHIEDRARELLGLSEEEAGKLFHTYDNAESLRILEQFIKEAENEATA